MSNLTDKDDQKMVSIEIIAYFMVLISAVLYSIYKVVHEDFIHYEDFYNDFTSGWQILHRRKDGADYEWESVLVFVIKMLPWLIVYLAVSEYLRKSIYFKVIPYWQILLTMLFTTFEIGGVVTVLLVVQPLAFECLSKFKSQAITWICSIFFLICVSASAYFNESVINRLGIDSGTVPMLCWINLRCLSYYTDIIKLNESKHSLKGILSYCLYLPTLFLGPFMFYSDFEKSQKSTAAESLFDRMREMGHSLLRFGGWLIFTEFSLHYVYVNVLKYHPEKVNSMDNWTLYGYGYCMGQFFHLKYVVRYGFSKTIAEFEHITMPRIPKCIGRIHLYSDMWKYFDEGLYKFLVRYIYVPTLKTKTIGNKIFSSSLCFLFVFVWHGMQMVIFIWAVLNFLGITLEALFVFICHTKHLQQCIIRHLNAQWIRRLACIFASPLLGLSAISNFFFFADISIGNIFFARVLSDSLLNNSILLFILYCYSQISTEVRAWETCNKTKQSIQ